MSLPTGVPLTATFKFYKAGVLADPSPLPTAVTGSTYPDATAGPTPALTHAATGVFTATVFSTLQSTQIGTYDAYVYSSDTTLDSQYAAVEWVDVGINNVTANQDKTGYALSGAGVTAVQAGLATSTALATAQTDIDAVQAQTDQMQFDADGNILAVMEGLGPTPIFVTPLSPDGRTLYLTIGDDYLVANGRQIDWPLPAGFPDLEPGQDVTLGLEKYDFTTMLVTGTALDERNMRLEIPTETTSILRQGRSTFSILEVVSSTRNTPYAGTVDATRVRTSDV